MHFEYRLLFYGKQDSNMLHGHTMSPRHSSTLTPLKAHPALPPVCYPCLSNPCYILLRGIYISMWQELVWQVSGCLYLKLRQGQLNILLFVKRLQQFLKLIEKLINIFVQLAFDALQEYFNVFLKHFLYKAVMYTPVVLFFLGFIINNDILLIICFIIYI